jgi:hypothetical protein
VPSVVVPVVVVVVPVVVLIMFDNDGKRRDAVAVEPITPTRPDDDATSAALAAEQTHITAIKLTEFLKKRIS